MAADFENMTNAHWILLPERRDQSPSLQKSCGAAWVDNLILFNLYLVFIR